MSIIGSYIENLGKAKKHEQILEHNRLKPTEHNRLKPSRLESIMLHSLLMLFDISPTFCLLYSFLFLCFLGMHYADNIYL